MLKRAGYLVTRREASYLGLCATTIKIKFDTAATCHHETVLQSVGCVVIQYGHLTLRDSHKARGEDAEVCCQQYCAQYSVPDREIMPAS